LTREPVREERSAGNTKHSRFVTFRTCSRRHFLSLGAASAAGLALPGQFAAAADRDVYRWGSSSLGSSGYVIMEAFAQTANRYTTLRNSSLATAGTAENMSLIGRGLLEFAHSTSVDWIAALRGDPPYRHPVRANQLFAYASWQQVPIVLKQSGLRSVTDLAGKRFGPSQPGSGTAAMYRVILQASGIRDAVNWRYGSWSEIYTAFRARQLDAVVGVMTNRVPSSWIRQLDSTLELQALEIPAEILAAASSSNPGVSACRAMDRPILA
jgi:TRAP transporter TAXI family solute receptor